VSRNIEISSVAENEVVVAQGGSASIIVRGDVGEGARLTAQGGSARIEVGGYIHAHASLVVQGGSSKIIHHGKHGTARCVAQGGDSKVIDKSPGGPKAAPKRNTGDYGFGSFFGSPRSLGDFAVGSRQDYGTLEPKPDRHTLQVQKSGRPRELWGT
jgi:hypothetical protein